MTRFKDVHGTPITLGDTVFYDGYYTVKQYEDGQYYLKSHHKHKTVTPFNEDVPLDADNARLMEVLTVRGRD